MNEAVMKSCDCSEQQAQDYIDGEIEMARQNYQADGNLEQAVQDCLNGLGLDSDYAMAIAEQISIC